MRVVFLEDVSGVALGGEVKEVKGGFARNYLIPQKLAIPATPDALQRVERLGKQAEEHRIKTLQDMKELGALLEGSTVDVPMRAGASGRLYGSVTNAIVAEGLSKMTGREIDRRTIELPDSVREVGIFDARLRLHAEVTATVSVLVHPVGSDPDEVRAALEAGDAEAEAEENGAAEEPPQAEPESPE